MRLKNKFIISLLVAGILAIPAALVLAEFGASSPALVQLETTDNLPWSLNLLSPVYQSISTTTIQINYVENKKLPEYKQIFYYRATSSSWLPLVTKDFPQQKYLQATTSEDLIVGAFSYPGVITAGQASWYKYKGGDFAASPDFPKGSKIRVYNTANNKFVDVIINDWGPERLKFPSRVIDLDAVAFSKIASKSAGVINVRIEPLEIKADSRGKILGLGKNGAPVGPTWNFKSALVVREKDQKIMYSQNVDELLSLASLTKLIAVKTWLDIDSNRKYLSKIVTYKSADAQLNYKYVSPSESGKLSLKNGQKISLKDLLYISLIASTNNTVETLVRNSGVSRDKFIALMNANVKKWGATSTVLIEPTGLAPQNQTTARDYIQIMKKAYSDPIIAQATTMVSYKFKDLATKKTRTIRNTNQLLGLMDYEIKGSKTGYLDEAGYCLSMRFKQGSDFYNVVTLGASTRERSFYGTDELIEYSLK